MYLRAIEIQTQALKQGGDKEFKPEAIHQIHAA